jgi:hypothetical protein
MKGSVDSSTVFQYNARRDSRWEKQINKMV